MDEPRAAVLTVSDGVNSGTRDDDSGDMAEAQLLDAGFDVASRRVVPDERSEIESAIVELASTHALVVTTGGTGFGPRDVTPEATRAVIERESPGLAEVMRAAGLTKTPLAALSRAVAGALGGALVLNLPGSPNGVRESLDAVLPVVPHAVELLGGATGEHPTGHPPSERSERVPNQDSPTNPAWTEVKAVKVVRGSPPCEVGALMVVEPNGPVRGTLGCAEFDSQGVEAANEAWVSGGPTTRVLHHDEGDIEVYVEPHRPPPHVIVVSATDVARSLRAHLRWIGYQIVLVESRADRVTEADEPALRTIDGLDLAMYRAAVLTDHDAPNVTTTLATLLHSPVAFIGVMGSRRHVAHYVDELRELGFKDDDLARIRSPLGLDIGGRRPEEIALSIAAGIVADAHGRDGGWLDR